MTVKTYISVVTLILLSACGGGGGSSSTTPSTPSSAFSLTSTAFSNGASIPTAYRCVPSGGAGNLPQLAWSNLPSATKSIVIIMDDVDAQAVQGSTYTHYFALIPYQSQLSSLTSIDTVSSPTLPYEKVWSTGGQNWVVLADLPPCNPTGTAHTYRWTIYALNTEYNSIPAMKTEFDTIINSSLSTTGNTENLNYTVITGSNAQETPKFTRSTFESSYSSYIIDKATLAGTM